MKIILNKQFYSIEAIEETLNDFKDVCDGRILNDKIEVEIFPKEEVRQLKEEFCNYVLGLMKNKNLI